MRVVGVLVWVSIAAGIAGCSCSDSDPLPPDPGREGEACTESGCVIDLVCCYEPGRPDGDRVCREMCDFCRSEVDCLFEAECCVEPGSVFGLCQPSCPRVDAGVPPDVDARVDPPRDGGGPGTDPPSSPIPTASRPERPRPGPSPRSSTLLPISFDEPTIVIAGEDEIAVHDLLTGAELTRVPAPGRNYATEVLAVDVDRLVTVGAMGARANGCTPTGISPFAQLLYPISPPNVTSIALIGASGTATEAILTDNAGSQIERIAFDASTGLFGRDQSSAVASTSSGGSAVSAAAPVGSSPVLVAVDGMPGALRWIDWDATPPTVVDVGELGDQPRILGCAPDGRRCFVPSYGSGTVTVVDTSVSPPAILETVPVGDGPVSVDAAEIDGATVAAVTGFVSGTLDYLVVEGATVRVVRTPLDDCASPGHALLVPSLRWIVVTCNADDTFVVRRIPPDVP